MNHQTQDPAFLHPHPSLRYIPAPAKDGPEVCAVADTIRETGGFMLPIPVDSGHRILTDDGRLRWLGAKRLGLDQVPVIIQPDEVGPMVVLSAIIHRAHYTKSAIAYLAVPLLQPALDACRARRAECLKTPANPVVHSVHYGKTLAELADSLGVCRRLLASAQEVHKIFDRDHRKYPFQVDGGVDDGGVVEETLREHFEPKILRQQVDSEHAESRPLGLGAVMKAIGSIRATKGQAKRTDSQLELFTGAFRSLRGRFRYWQELTPADKRAAVEVIHEWVQAMPQDLLGQLEEAIQSRQQH